jgi:hypothetical protein
MCVDQVPDAPDAAKFSSMLQQLVRLIDEAISKTGAEATTGGGGTGTPTAVPPDSLAGQALMRVNMFL